ncbi:MAG TPA: 4Fe-4S binding protein [candidate division Zixibacteria bacterium]|nr:4Fe-4S binding protein [candidate division Zixibacteria bacterium]
MSDTVYERLANALDRLPNGFPRTPSKVEIRVLKKIFSPEEAKLASQLSGSLESIDTIAKKVRLSVQETEEKLTNMAKRGLVWYEDEKGKPFFRLAPFIVGVYESQLENMDHELAHLVEEYLANGGALGIMKPQPALHRVIPAQKALKSELILPYDDVKAILLNSKSFGLRECICRVQRKTLGHKCDFPLKTCLSFSSFERPPHENTISQKEALAFLDEAEEIGLVHTVSNVLKGVGYVCNCCGCCCGILRGINDWGIENSVAHANYTATIDPDTCLNCGTCRTRCQVHAITEQNGTSFVNTQRCIGCGLCVTGCPNNAAQLNRKPSNEIINPPQDFTTWEHERLHNRGLIK